MSVTANNKEFSLPVEELTRIGQDSPPNSFTVRHLKQEVCGNASAISTTLRGEGHGHLGMVMPQIECMALVPAPLAPHVQPLRPAVPHCHDTAAVVATTKLNCETNPQLCTRVNSLERPLQSQAIVAIQPIHIQALCDNVLGHRNVTTRDIITHLKTHCGTITQDDMESNMEILEGTWDPESPFKTVINCTACCQQFSIAGQDPISDEAPLRAVLKALEASGALTEAIKDWRKCAAANHTWPPAQTLFRIANKECKRAATTADLGFHANAAHSKNNANQSAPMLAFTDANMAHCWSHGRSHITAHTSLAHNDRLPGHDKTATACNMKGGKDIIRHRQGEVALWRLRRNPNTNNGAAKNQS